MKLTLSFDGLIIDKWALAIFMPLRMSLCLKKMGLVYHSFYPHQCQFISY